MSEFALVASRDAPTLPEVGHDLSSHTRAITAIREALLIGDRRTNKLLASYVRVSELVSLGLIEIQGGKLAVRARIDPPRLTTGERDAIVNPQDGALIYNTTAGQFQGRAAGAWVAL